ncbi:MAG: Crp/Fnr family transcriptional regulator [Leptolyngbya sp. DLM2.Bin15]|nr:MAG: Crp/Fnr family transcriptional regulator [Leptolyngbya sp. DLM2.Bin15]
MFASLPSPISIALPQHQSRLQGRQFNRKDLLPINSDCIWKIDSGLVRTFTWDESGRIMTLGFWGAGDVVGYPLSYLDPYFIECLTPVTVWQVLPDSSYVKQALWQRVGKSEEFLSIVHQHDVGGRLMHLLIWLADQFGQPIAEGQLLDVHLTHQLLAETAHTTRVTVTRILNQWEREGKLKRSTRSLILLKQDLDASVSTKG